MKKSLLKKLTRMARDGDPEAVEALAEAVEEIVEAPSAEEVTVIAAAAEPETEPAVEVAPAEEGVTVSVDNDTLTAILERLDQLIALLTPAAGDEDPAEAAAAPAPEEIPEELSEVVEEVLENVEETAGEPALEQADYPARADAALTALGLRLTGSQETFSETPFAWERTLRFRCLIHQDLIYQ